MKLNAVDLNLLPVLEALLRQRSVTRAGEEIGLTQPATSHALIRLRKIFDDALLVPSGREMQPTPMARRLEPVLRDALQKLELAIVEREHFDPFTSTRQFRIMTSDYAAGLILPKLLNLVDRSAPGVSFEVTWSEPTFPEDLIAERLDIVVMPQGNLTGKNIRSELLFADDLVVIAGLSNPEIGDTLDLKTYKRLPHVTFQKSGNDREGFASQQERRQSILQWHRVLVPDLLLLPLIISESGCIALTHRSLAERLMLSAPVRIFPPPFSTEPLQVTSYWSQAVDADPGHQWFRATLREACKSLSVHHETASA